MQYYFILIFIFIKTAYPSEHFQEYQYLVFGHGFSKSKFEFLKQYLPCINRTPYYSI